MPGSIAQPRTSLTCLPTDVFSVLALFLGLEYTCLALAQTCHRVRSVIEGFGQSCWTVLCSQLGWSLPSVHVGVRFGKRWSCQGSLRLFSSRADLQRRTSIALHQLSLVLTRIRDPVKLLSEGKMCDILPKELPSNFSFPLELLEFYSKCDGLMMVDVVNCSLELDRSSDLLEHIKEWIAFQAEEQLSEEDLEDEELQWWETLHPPVPVGSAVPRPPGSPLWVPIGREDATSTIFVCCDVSHPDFGAVSSASAKGDGSLEGRFLASNLLRLLEGMCRGLRHVLSLLTAQELIALRDCFVYGDDNQDDDAYKLFRSCQAWLSLSPSGE
eukprot:RCo039032